MRIVFTHSYQPSPVSRLAYRRGMSPPALVPFDPRSLEALTPADLRARGSLKWTAVTTEIAAWVAESDLGTAPAVTAAAVAAVTDGLTGYLPPAPRAAMAQACADWHHQRYGWDVPARWVHPVADVLEALHVAVEHFSRPGSAVVVPTPAYMPFLTVPRQWGRDVVQVPMTTDGGRPVLDLEAIDAALGAGGGLVTLVNPHNPTGRVHTRDELAALGAVVERHGARVFADEIHAPLVHTGHRHVPYASVSAATAAHTITATSASKAWNIPGLKCAQLIVSNEADAATFEPVSFLATHGASTPGVLANAAAYREGGPWLDGVLDYLAGNATALADVLAEHAPAVRYTPPEGTYLAWLDLRAALAGHDLPVGRWLAEHAGVEVVDGIRCGRVGRGFARLTLAMPRPLVVAAGRRIAAALAEA